MDHHEHVGGGNQPSGPLEGKKNVVFDSVAEHPIADEGDGEVAEGDHNVGHNHAFPHGAFGGLVRSGRDCGLYLKHHVVACVREGYVPQRCEEVEHCARG